MFNRDARPFLNFSSKISRLSGSLKVDVVREIYCNLGMEKQIFNKTNAWCGCITWRRLIIRSKSSAYSWSATGIPSGEIGVPKSEHPSRRAFFVPGRMSLKALIVCTDSSGVWCKRVTSHLVSSIIRPISPNLVFSVLRSLSSDWV